MFHPVSIFPVLGLQLCVARSCISGVGGVKPRALCMLGKPFAFEPYPKPLCNCMHFLSFVLLNVVKT